MGDTYIFENEMNMKPCCPITRCSMYLPYLLEQYIFNEYHNIMRLKPIPSEEIKD
jgi:hypothetical protein